MRRYTLEVEVQPGMFSSERVAVLEGYPEPIFLPVEDVLPGDRIEVRPIWSSAEGTPEEGRVLVDVPSSNSPTPRLWVPFGALRVAESRA